MIKTIEQNYITTFVNKRMRERIIFELSSTKYRRNAINRFTSPEEILLSNSIKFKNKNFTAEDISNEIKKIFDINRDVYIMVDDAEECKIINFRDALKFAMDYYGTCIMICDEKTAFIKEAWGIGNPFKYILYRELT